MKTSSLLLLMMLLASSAFAQKKGKVDPKDVRIDSLTQATHALTVRLDSASKDLVVYQGMYDVVKTKVFKYAFKPERTGVLIDSLRTIRTATVSGLKGQSTALADTVATLRAENLKLKGEVAASTDAATQKAAAIADLKEYKGLLDQKIITPAEYETRKAKLMEKL